MPPPDDPDSSGNSGLDGIGLCLTPGNEFVGIDLDKCLNERGELVDEDAKHALELLSGTYVEVSPSGTGLRVFCRGRKPGTRSKSGNREIYDGRDAKGNPGGRYLTLTGHSYGEPQPIVNKQDAIDELYERWFAAPNRPKEVPKTPLARGPQPPTLDDAALLERVFASKKGAAVRALWEGSTSAYAEDKNDGESEADLALASQLLWWCDYDAARADKLFRQSGLYRPKWDQDRGGQSYGQRTLEKAAEGKGPGEGYSPRMGRAGADAEDGIVTAGDYADKGNVIHRRKSKMSRRGGEWEEEIEDIPLCNFSARITEERERDDGVERTLLLVISGTLATGQPLPPAEVSAAQFGGMNWPVSAWGSRAVVYAGQGTKDHLRAALQMLSGDVPRRVTYTHLGWREIGGRTVYLHAGGIISAPVAPDAPLAIQVEPPGGLEAFALPEPPTGDALRRAIRSSIATLELAPDPVSVPLLGATYRAPFGSVDFGVHLAGQTGAGKSELAAIFQAHYGAGLTARTLPGSWSSTANALEGLAFAGKDVLVTVDDFAPEGSAYDIARYHAAAARLFRAQGNNAARGRMRAGGSLRPNKPPRGMVLSTGEDIPKGHNIKARTLILELEPRALNWPLLTEVQARAREGVYAAAMSGFIAWLAEDHAGRTAQFRGDHARFRAELQSTGTGHKRTVDAGAQLLATYRSLLAFALDVNALTDAEHAALWGRVYRGV